MNCILLPLGLSELTLPHAAQPHQNWEAVDVTICSKNAQGGLEAGVEKIYPQGGLWYDESGIAVNAGELHTEPYEFVLPELGALKRRRTRHLFERILFCNCYEKVADEKEIFHYTRPRRGHYYHHIPSGDLFEIKPVGKPDEIRAKALRVLAFSLIYMVAMMVGNMVAALIHTVVVLKDPGKELYLHGVKACFSALKDSSYKIVVDVCIVLVSPLYWIAMEFSAIVALFSPLDGVRNLFLVDYAWHQGTSYKEEILRYGCKHPAQDVVRPLFFLVFCMHRRGNTREEITGFVDGNEQTVPRCAIVANSRKALSV